MRYAGMLLLWFTVSQSLLGAQAATQTEAYQLYLRSVIESGQGNLTGASDYMEKAIARSPHSAFLYYSHAELAFRQNQLDKAAEQIEKAISLDPQNVKTYILAGQIYWAAGEQDKAEDRLKKAVKLDPDEAEALVNLAMAVGIKNPQEAIRLYKDFLSRHPYELEIQERVAQLYSQLGETEKAKEAWGRVLESQPESIRAHLASAQIAEMQYDTHTAIGHYEAVLEQDPTNLPLLLRVGELQYRNFEMSKAFEAFSRAQTIAPDSPSANFWLALVSENRGDWGKAIQLLKNVAAKAPEPGVRLRLSYYYAQNGQQKEAIAVLKQLSEQEPENTDFLRYLAVGYEQNKQYPQAIQAVQKLLEIDPHNPDHYFHLAALYDRLRKFSLVESSLLKAIDLDPEFHMALNYLGYSYADQNIKLEEAEKLLNAAVSLDPENGAYLDSLGWVYFRQGRLDKAEDFILQATQNGKDPLIFEHLGDVQMASGKTLAAIKAWQGALRIEPAQPGVLKKIDRAMMKISAEEKMRLLFHRAQIDMSTIASLKGLVEIGMGTKRPTFKTRAQFNYEQEGRFSIETPGPLGGPLFLISKSTDGPVQYGAVHPALQSVEPDAVRAFDRLEGVLRGRWFDEWEKLGPTPTVEERGGSLVVSQPPIRLRFESKSGQLREIRWTEGPQADTLRLENYSSLTSPSVPLKIIWTDDQTGFVFEFHLIRPLVFSTIFRAGTLNFPYENPDPSGSRQN